jgi:hypothetical protein
MRKFVAVLVVASVISVAMRAETASAAPVSPSSSRFGGNGY